MPEETVNSQLTLLYQPVFYSIAEISIYISSIIIFKSLLEYILTDKLPQLMICFSLIGLNILKLIIIIHILLILFVKMQEIEYETIDHTSILLNFFTTLVLFTFNIYLIYLFYFQLSSVFFYLIMEFIYLYILAETVQVNSDHTRFLLSTSSDNLGIMRSLWRFFTHIKISGFVITILYVIDLSIAIMLGTHTVGSLIRGVIITLPAILYVWVRIFRNWDILKYTEQIYIQQTV